MTGKPLRSVALMYEKGMPGAGTLAREWLPGNRADRCDAPGGWDWRSWELSVAAVRALTGSCLTRFGSSVALPDLVDLRLVSRHFRPAWSVQLTAKA